MADRQQLHSKKTKKNKINNIRTVYRLVHYIFVSQLLNGRSHWHSCCRGCQGRQRLRTIGRWAKKENAEQSNQFGLGVMSTTTYNVRSKQMQDGSLQKMGPIKATIPMSSFLRPLNGGSVSSDCTLFAALSPPMRHISPDHQSCGHRSPCAANYYQKCKYIAFHMSI